MTTEEAPQGANRDRIKQALVAWPGIVSITLLMAFLLYGRNLPSGFLLDDFGHLVDLRHSIFADNVSTGEQSAVRPVGWTVFGVVFHLFGPNPAPFHFVSIVGLAATGLCLAWLWSVLFPKGARSGPLLASLLFVLWPNHGEAVCWAGCFPDIFAGLFGTLALGCWATCGTRFSIPAAILGLTSCLLAVAAKESALPLALAMPLFAWLTVAQGKGRWWEAHWLRRRRCWILSLAPLITVLGFWAVRTQILGTVIGGYHRKSPFEGGMIHLVGWRGLCNVANMYFPFARMARYWGQFYTSQVIGLMIAAGLLSVALSWPVRDGTRGREARVGLCALSLLTSWALVLFLDTIGFVELLRENANWLYAGLEILAIWLMWRWLLRKVADEHQLDLILSFRPLLLLTGLFLSYYIFNRASSSVDEMALMTLGFAAAFGLRWRRASADPVAPWMLIALAVPLSIASIYLVMNLPAALDGQWERFSYFGSIFACLAWTALLQQLGKNRLAIWTALLLLLSGQLWVNVGRWVHVGRLSNETAAILRTAPDNSTCYVLAAPGTDDGAGLFQIGIPLLPEALWNRKTVKAVVGSIIQTGTPGDTLIVTELPDDAYMLTVMKLSGNALYKPVVVDQGDPAFLRIDGGVKIGHRRPGDMVLAVGLDRAWRIH